MVSSASLMQDWLKATPAAARTKLSQCRAALLGAGPQPGQLAATYLPAGEPGPQLEEYLALSDTALLVQGLGLPAHTQILSQHSSHLRALFAADRSRGATPSPADTQQQQQEQGSGWAGWWRPVLQWMQAHLSLTGRNCNPAGSSQPGSSGASSGHSVSTSNGTQSLHPQASVNNGSLPCSTGCSPNTGSCQCSSWVDLERCGGRLLVRLPDGIQLDEALTVLKCVYAAGPTTSQLHGKVSPHLREYVRQHGDLDAVMELCSALGLAGLLKVCGEFLSKSPKLVQHDPLRWLLLAERYSLAPLRTLCLEQLLLALACEPERGLAQLLQDPRWLELDRETPLQLMDLFATAFRQAAAQLGAAVDASTAATVAKGIHGSGSSGSSSAGSNGSAWEGLRSTNREGGNGSGGMRPAVVLGGRVVPRRAVPHGQLGAQEAQALRERCGLRVPAVAL